MSALTKLQQDFQRYVYRMDRSMDGRITRVDKADADERLKIYADAYRLRLIEVLGNDLPGLQLLAGPEKFERLSRAYIETQPSIHFNVRWYGGGLADFLRQSSPWEDEPALAEMAQLEWAMTLVFDACDEPVAGMDAVATIPPAVWPGMVPVLQSALQQVSLHWNVQAIRKAVDQNSAPPTLQRLPHPVMWQIWRKDFTVYYRPLEADEAWALRALQSGANFAELCEGLCTWLDETQVAVRAAWILKRWFEDGLIREVRLPPS